MKYGKFLDELSTISFSGGTLLNGVSIYVTQIKLVFTNPLTSNTTHKTSVFMNGSKSYVSA